ncbi:MAG: CRISPR-associated protein Csx16 [Granulosicoccus sp.]
MKRLITFLGTGDYQSTQYCWEHIGKCSTSYITDALTQLWKPDEVVVLATPESKAKHFDNLKTHIEKHSPIPVRCIEQPAGRDTNEQWQQFEILQKHLRADKNDEVLLDITHGFRAQPFMAGAAVSVLQAANQLTGEVSIVYGEYNRETKASCVWDLSLYIQLMEWAQALNIFMQTGVATSIVALGEQAKKNESKRVRDVGGKNYPQFGSLVSAIEQFANDLSTLRLASIITGFDQKYAQGNASNANTTGSAAKLLTAISDRREEVAGLLPPLALVLEQLANKVKPLISERLASTTGLNALRALAGYYMTLHRFPEAAVAMREAQVNRYAMSSTSAVEINSPLFSAENRSNAESNFREYHPGSKTIAKVRNDIQHGGMNEQPLKAKKLIEELEKLIEHGDWSEISTDPIAATCTPRTLFVSRHPGAQQWADSQGLSIDKFITHLNLEDTNKGDLIIGTLPLNLIAIIHEHGCQYIHLSLNLKPELRGKELSAQELSNCDARLSCFSIREYDIDDQTKSRMFIKPG